jgi:hypothetical protein
MSIQCFCQSVQDNQNPQLKVWNLHIFQSVVLVLGYFGKISPMVHEKSVFMSK